MLSVVTKSAIVVAMASAAGSMVDAASVPSIPALSTSCMNAANKYRTTAGATLFPALTASAAADMSLDDAAIEAQFCVQSDAKVIATSSITGKIAYFQDNGTKVVEDCGPAVDKWHRDGLLAIKGGNPANYVVASPPAFYTSPTNVAFAGVTFGKENIALGTAALRCTSVMCTAGGKPIVVCDVVAANNDPFVVVGKPVWSKAEYDALVALPTPTPSGAEIPVASILGLSATALGLMASL